MIAVWLRDGIGDVYNGGWAVDEPLAIGDVIGCLITVDN